MRFAALHFSLKVFETQLFFYFQFHNLYILSQTYYFNDKMKSLEEYDATEILEILATNVVATARLNKNVDAFTIICTCVFNTMTYCCTHDMSDRVKAMGDVMEFSAKFEKIVEMINENSCNDKEEK